MQIIQNPEKFKFTIDAFLLTGFVDPGPKDHLIDLGAGGGVLSLLIAGTKRIGSVCGLEIQTDLADMARRSVALNGLDTTIRIVDGDLRRLPSELKHNSFDYVIANPPFYPENKGVISQNQALAMAKFEISCKLEDLVVAAKRLVKGNGKFAMIFPSQRFTELLIVLHKNSLTPKRICFIHPKPGFKSNLVLIESRPGSGHGVEILSPIIVSDQYGEYSEMMNRIFQGEKIK
ncbi:MAG: methyltransferase [Firmicutes bacterium]|nr:methyltransferase [Bacillota bacterium]